MCVCVFGLGSGSGLANPNPNPNPSQPCIAATACDLCPEAGHATTLQCDFLRLEVGPEPYSFP